MSVASLYKQELRSLLSGSINAHMHSHINGIHLWRHVVWFTCPTFASRSGPQRRLCLHLTAFKSSLSAREWLTAQDHYSAVTSLSFTPEGDRLLTAGRDKVANLWDVATYKKLATVPVFEAIEGEPAF